MANYHLTVKKFQLTLEDISPRTQKVGRTFEGSLTGEMVVLLSILDRAKIGVREYSFFDFP